MSTCSRIGVAVVAMIALLTATRPSAASADAKPSIAVLDFSTTGLTSNWYGSFQPGVALSDLVTDRLVNGDKFNVVERKKLDAVLVEHKLSTDGEVSPATYVQSGQLTGAHYLVTGNILQFDKTGQSGAGAIIGGLLGHAVGDAAGNLQVEKVTLRVQVHIIDTTTGSIVQSFEGSDTKSGTSWGGGGVGYAFFRGFGAGSYENKTFTESTMGKLIDEEAQNVVAKFDPSRFAGAASAGSAALTGRIIAADSYGIILNIGSRNGVTVGMYFNVVKERQIKDPDSGKMLTVTSSTAKVQITQANADSAVATRVSGVVGVGERVTLAP